MPFPPNHSAADPLLLPTGEKIVVGVLADPDLPGQIARYLADVLPAELSAHVSSDVDWKIDIVDDPFASSMRYERIIDKARLRSEGREWDIALCLTDMPLPKSSGAVVAMISVADRVALISLPALGGLRLRRRARDIAITLIDDLTAPRDADSSNDSTGSVAHRPTDASHLTRRATPADGDVDIELITPARRGRLHLLAGIVRGNQPWQLVLGLSTALAGAAAGSAFGILYSAIWELAAVLEPWRLAAVTVGGIAVLAVWLLAGHRLWRRRRQPKPLSWLVNAATVLTVVNGVLVFYVALFVINSVAAALVIPPHHMAETLGRPVGWIEYLRVALMATALGTVAGAVGSGLEDDETVRRAAYSTRTQERRRLLQRDG